MIQVFSNGIRIPVEGGKIIEEFMGVNRGQEQFSVAHMLMPSGWSEPHHGTEFNEIVVVVKGELTVLHNGQKFKIPSGQIGWIEPSKKVAFLNESSQICEYWAICSPAYHPSRVHYSEEGIHEGES